MRMRFGNGDGFGDGRGGHFGEFAQDHGTAIPGAFRATSIDDQDIVGLGHKQDTALRIAWRDGPV
jgi:hypothetical protein